MNFIKSYIEQFGSKFNNLIAEGNLYNDSGNKTGIGYHGDAERSKVIGMRFGKTNESMPLYFRWFNNSKPISEPIQIKLNNGDIYIMSEKTTGYDWKKRSIYTLRHSVGADKYIKLPK